MNNENLIKFELSEDNEIMNYDILNLDLDFESLENNELRMIDYLENEIEIRLYNYHDFDIYNYNQISKKEDDFEILLDREYSLYFDREDNSSHYYFEIHDLNNEDEILFSIELLNDSHEYLDNIYEIIKNYIYSLIDYNKKIFNKDN